MDYLRQCVVIAYFVGGRPMAKSLQARLGQPKLEVKDEVQLGRDLEYKFFQVARKNELTLQKILMQTLHISQ